MNNPRIGTAISALAASLYKIVTAAAAVIDTSIIQSAGERYEFF